MPRSNVRAQQNFQLIGRVAQGACAAGGAAEDDRPFDDADEDGRQTAGALRIDPRFDQVPASDGLPVGVGVGASGAEAFVGGGGFEGDGRNGAAAAKVRRFDVVGQRAQKLDHARSRVGLGGEDFLQPRGDGPVGATDGLLDQFILAFGEVVVERPLGRAAVVEYLVQPGGGVALLLDEFAGGVDDLVAFGGHGMQPYIVETETYAPQALLASLRLRAFQAASANDLRLSLLTFRSLHQYHLKQFHLPCQLELASYYHSNGGHLDAAAFALEVAQFSVRCSRLPVVSR